MKNVCFELPHVAFPIVLSQQRHNRFTVIYGKQVKEKLTYSPAALELGACIMHAMSCDGKLDSRLPGE